MNQHSRPGLPTTVATIEEWNSWVIAAEIEGHNLSMI